MTAPRQGPLVGTVVLELAGIGPGPYCAQILADLGADVIRLARPRAAALPVENRGKRSITVDLRKPEAAELVLRLVESADALIEGFRPGVAERLGVGPEAALSRNPRLVYGRMTGWGQTGPWARTAGHDINYIGLTGALHAMGARDQPPPPPLNLVGDYGGGSLFLALGIVSAMHRAKVTGRGDVVDAAILDGVSSMLGVVQSLRSVDRWHEHREANLLDGGLPYYRCYTTADGKFMAVGCLEPEFFSIMLELLGLEPTVYGDRDDRSEWLRQEALLATTFAARSRDEWAVLFDGSDACVTPVLSIEEAPLHPHNQARLSHIKAGGISQPHPAPRFASDGDTWTPPALSIEGSTHLLIERGFDAGEVNELISQGVVSAPVHP